MNPSPDSPPVGQRSETLRLFRWLFEPRTLRVALGLLACLLTLVAAIYVFENWRGRRAWRAMAADLAQRGQRIDLAAFVPPPVPDEQNFALTPSLAPLFDFLPGTQRMRDTNAQTRLNALGRDLPSTPPAPDNMARGQLTPLDTWAVLLNPKAATNDPAACARTVIAGFQKYDPLLAELRQASQRPASRFAIKYDLPDPSGILLPHLSVLRCANQAAAMRAAAELALGQPDAAEPDLQLAFALADTIRTEPILISHLVRIAMHQRALCTLWDGLARHQWSEAQLAAFQNRLARQAIWADFAIAIQGERAFGNAIIALVQRDPPMLNRLGTPSDGPFSEANLPEDLFLRAIPSGWFDLERVEYNRGFAAVMLQPTQTASGTFDPAAVEAASRSLDFGRGGFAALRQHRILSALLLPALSNAYRKAAYTQVHTDQAVLACALERFRLKQGRFPERLEELTPAYLDRIPPDLIKGGALHYQRPDPQRFVLYSIGWNGVDDGGTPGLNDHQRLDPTTGDWVWRTP